jgi:outer membrane phospholipase A
MKLIMQFIKLPFVFFIFLCPLVITAMEDPLRFTPHMKNYFITGLDNTRYGNQSKFQFSYKIKIRSKKVFGGVWYFSYTQLSFFDPFINANNKYLYDIIYTPEFFLRWQVPSQPFIDHIGIGIKHGSNGRGESWGDRIMVHSKFSFFDRYSLITRIWSKSFTMSSTKAIDSYLGDGEVVFMSNFKTIKFEGRTALGISSHIPFFFEICSEIPLNKSTHLYIQYWNGYAETFYTDADVSPNVEYFRRRTKRFRVGVSIPMDINYNS